MKNLLLALSLVFTFAIQAQQISPFLTVPSGLYGGIVYDEAENSVYVASGYDGVIYQKDATGGDGTYETINSGGEGSRQTGLFKLGGSLYVNRWHDNAVMQVGLDAGVEPQSIATITRPGGLTGRGNKLYVSSQTFIYEVDLSTTPATVSTIIDGLQVSVFGPEIGLKIYNDYLYVSETNKISRINLNVTPYVKETYLNFTFTPLSFAWLNENELFVTSNDYQTIYSVINGVPTILVQDNSTDYPAPNDLAYIGNSILLASCAEGFNVMQVDLPLINTDSHKTQNIVLSPNPASAYINLSGVTTPEEVIITNTLGQAVANYNNTSQYDVSALPSGMYYLQVKGQSLKFIKK